MEIDITHENIYHEAMSNECKTEEDSRLENIRHKSKLKNIEIIEELER